MDGRLHIFSLAPRETKLSNGETVYLRAFTAGDRLAYYQYILKLDTNTPDDAIIGDAEFAAFLASIALTDKEGKQYFADGDVKSVLKTVDEKSLGTLFFEIQEMNHLGIYNEFSKKKETEATEITENPTTPTPQS